MPIRMTTVARLWSNAALIVWNTCIVFIILNLIFGVGSYIRHAYFPWNPIYKYRQQLTDLLRLYPTLSAEQVSVLLSETWSHPLVFEPFTDLAEAPFKGKYINISQNGYRLGLNQGPWPPKLDQDFVVFLFGGSTVFGYGVPDDQTMGSALQEALSRRLKLNVKVYNFGRGYYYSTQERILFEKLLSSNIVPNLAIFIDGMNDFYYANPKRELEFYPTLNDSIKPLLARLPLISVTNSMTETLFAKSVSAPTADYEGATFDQPNLLRGVIERYLRNKTMIEGAAQAFGSRALFVWEPTPLYKYDLHYHLFGHGGFGRHTFSRYGYPLMRETVDKQPLPNFIWCADIQDGIKEPLYVDETHYTPKLIGILAECIVKGVE